MIGLRSPVRGASRDPCADGSPVHDVAAVPDPLAEWCQAVFGRFAVVSARAAPRDGSAIWRLSADRGYVYLKAYRRVAKWNMEVHAYECWIAALEGQAPQLIAALEPPTPAILIAELPGIPLDRATLPARSERAAWRAAGAALARWHALPKGKWFGPPRRDGSPGIESPETDPVALVASCLEDWLSRAMAANLLSASELETAKSALAGASLFAGEPPVACHGDYRPRNWLVGPDGAWRGVIDFEHARWDLKINDLGYWWDRGGWSERADLRAAFLAGYGRLTGRERQQLRIVRILGALGRIRWGQATGDMRALELGRKVLHQLASDRYSLAEPTR